MTAEVTAPRSPQIRSGRRARPLRALVAFLTLGLFAGGGVYYFVPRPVGASGGLPFLAAHVLPVGHFSQGDPRWASELLGTTPATLAAEGCALTSAAMVLAYRHPATVDPLRLNRYLTTHGGYTPEGWLYWEKAPAYGGWSGTHYEDLPSFYLIDRNLMENNPVIVRVRLARGTTHFVVIVGKSGFDYLIQDPALPDGAGAYPLKRLVSRIDALRFYPPGA